MRRGEERRQSCTKKETLLGGRKNGHISIISKNKTIKTKIDMDRKRIEGESGESRREKSRGVERRGECTEK